MDAISVEELIMTVRRQSQGFSPRLLHLPRGHLPPLRCFPHLLLVGLCAC